MKLFDLFEGNEQAYNWHSEPEQRSMDATRQARLNREREPEGSEAIDARLRAQNDQLAQYAQSGNFWLKQKDTQEHISDVFVGKAAANAAALELLKQRPELKGNLVITAWGPGEQQGVAEDLSRRGFLRGLGAAALAGAGGSAAAGGYTPGKPNDWKYNMGVKRPGSDEPAADSDAAPMQSPAQTTGASSSPSTASKAAAERAMAAAEKIKYTNPKFKEEYERIENTYNQIKSIVYNNKRQYSSNPDLAKRQHAESVKALVAADKEFAEKTNALINQYGRLKEQGVAEGNPGYDKHSFVGKIRRGIEADNKGWGQLGNLFAADKEEDAMKALRRGNRYYNMTRGSNRTPGGFPKTTVEEGSGNIGQQIRALYQKIYDQGDDAVESMYYDSPIFAQYWDEYEGDLDSIIAEVDPSELQVILAELQSAAEDQGLAEAPGAETLSHNQSTVASNLNSLDLGENNHMGNVLPWPEVIKKINSAMRATGWKGQRQDDDSYLFSVKGQETDDQLYVVIVENQGNGMFNYALGTVEQGQPDIGEQDTLPNTDAGISELTTAITQGFGMTENVKESQNPYGYEVGQTVKLNNGKQGRVIDIFDDSIEVLLPGGRTVTVDFQDAEVLGEQGELPQSRRPEFIDTMMNNYKASLPGQQPSTSTKPAMGVDAKGRTQSQWLALVKKKFPAAKIMVTKMQDGPALAVLPDGRKLSWNKVEQTVAEGDYYDKWKQRADARYDKASDMFNIVQQRGKDRANMMSRHSHDSRERGYNRHQEKLDKMHQDFMGKPGLGSSGGGSSGSAGGGYYSDEEKAHQAQQRMARDEYDTQRRKDDDADTRKTFDMMRDRLNRMQYKNQRDVDPEQLKKISDIKYNNSDLGEGDISQLEKDIAAAPVAPIANMEGDEKIGGRYDADDFDAMVMRLKKLAGSGPMQTKYDPNKRVYRNVPTAQQPPQQPKK